MPYRPSFVIWLMSTLLAAVILLTTYTNVTVPVFTPLIDGHIFEALLIAYVMLWLGTVFATL